MVYIYICVRVRYRYRYRLSARHFWTATLEGHIRTVLNFSRRPAKRCMRGMAACSDVVVSRVEMQGLAVPEFSTSIFSDLLVLNIANAGTVNFWCLVAFGYT